MVCQGSLGVRGRDVPAIISPKPIGTLRKRLRKLCPQCRATKITRGICIIPLPIAARVMPIAQFFDSSEFDPETKRVMAVAFEMARAALQLGDQSILWERIAKKIIELTKTSELNPDVLCEAVLKEYCQHL